MRREHVHCGALGLLCLVISGTALADGPNFGPHDVQTLFFISKSNGQNRVDYGMRLDNHCAPAKKESVFPYWRDFKTGHAAGTRSLGTLENLAYGVSKQRLTRKFATGAEVEIELEAVERPIRVTTTRENNHCSALVRTTVAGVRDAELLWVYVKLSGPTSVDWILVRGRDPSTGRLLEERLQR